MADDYGLSTPERVELQYDVAGLGSRFVAALIDVSIQGVVILAFVFVAGSSGALVGRLGAWLGADGLSYASTLLALAVLLAFLVTWGYYIFFELVWNGQTPGKRRAGLRVMTTAGQPITLTHSLIRNLVRIVDFLPSSYMLGAAVMLLNSRAQRLGDLAAGTIVVKERREAPPPSLAAPAAGQELPPQQAAAIGAEDIALAREFLLRRAELSPDRRRALAEQIAERVRGRLGPTSTGSGPGAEPAEALLARVAAIRR